MNRRLIQCSLGSLIAGIGLTTMVYQYIIRTEIKTASSVDSLILTQSSSKKFSVGQKREDTLLKRENDFQDQLFKQTPLHVLRKAYFERLEILEKENISMRFPTPNFEPIDEYESAIESMYEQIMDDELPNSNWIGTTNLSINSKDTEVTFILKFFNNEMPQWGEGEPNEIKELCWVISSYFGKQASFPMGVSACLGQISKIGRGYFITQAISDEKLEPYFSYLGIQLPIRQTRSTDLDILDTKTQKWVTKSSTIQWRQVNSAQSAELEKSLLLDHAE